MLCPERERLEKEHAEAGAIFDAARVRLQARIGISQQEEFVMLNHALERSWQALIRARTALDHHLREHGCAAAAASNN
jgi:hypothetical protein